MGRLADRKYRTVLDKVDTRPALARTSPHRRIHAASDAAHRGGAISCLSLPIRVLVPISTYLYEERHRQIGTLELKPVDIHNALLKTRRYP